MYYSICYRTCKRDFLCAVLYFHLWPVRLYHSPPPDIFSKTTPFWDEVTEHKICFPFIYDSFSEKLFILWRIQRYIVVNVHNSSEISPTRCNNCVFIIRNGFTLHVSGENLTHHQEYSWWWVRLSPETCRVKPLQRINAIVASCWIYFTTTQLLCFIICLLQSSTCFEQRFAHHQEVKLY